MNTFVLLFHLYFFFGLAFSWSFNGHRIVADIAQSLLSPTVLSNCISKWFSNRSSFSLSSIAAHPDQFDGLRPLHFMNLQGDPPNGTFVYNEITCPTGNCVVDAVVLYEKIFATQPTPIISTEANPSALSFLIHFMGDLHQPLHISYKSDLGGNKVNVSFFNKITNLHSLWDGGMINKWISNEIGHDCGFSCGWRNLSNPLIKEVNAQIPLVNIWQNFSSYVSIAQESFEITNRNCFSFLKKKRDILESQQQNEPVALGLEYFNANFPIVRQRLMMGGARLAVALTKGCKIRMKN